MHSLPIAPLDPKTNGVTAPCSISRTLLLYSLFFSFLCLKRTFSVGWELFDSALRCAILKSKNATWPCLLKPLALTLSLESSSMLVDINSNWQEAILARLQHPPFFTIHRMGRVKLFSARKMTWEVWNIFVISHGKSIAKLCVIQDIPFVFQGKHIKPTRCTFVTS